MTPHSAQLAAHGSQGGKHSRPERSIARYELIAGLLLLLAGCGSEDFPGAPGAAGDLSVPYVTTYNFGFQVRFDPVFGADGNLQIISGGDLINLISAANITRLEGTGVIGGVVFNTSRNSQGDVVLAATDVNGRRVGDFFYNSLGGTPDFVQTRGTVSTGGFTAFNVAPGEVFLKAVGGGRGGTRLLAFPDEVSLGTVTVNPVVVPFIGILGEINNEAGRPITGSNIAIEVVGQRLSEATNCADEIPTQDRVDARLATTLTAFRFCIASEADYFARLSSSDGRYLPTYQTFNADTARANALQTTDITEFLTIQSRAGLEAAARAAGTTWDPTKGVLTALVRYGAGAPRSDAIVRITDENGTEIAAPGAGQTNLGTIVFIDNAGNPIAGADRTGESGRFIALNIPIPAGANSTTAYVSVTAERATAGVPLRYAGTAIVPLLRNAVVFQNLDTVALAAPIQGDDQYAPYFTGPVSGRVMREDGLLPVANARIIPFGVPVRELAPPVPADPPYQVFPAKADGTYRIEIHGDPVVPEVYDPSTRGNAAWTTPLLQANTYLVKVEGPVGSTEYLPTYQRIKTGTTEFDQATNQFRTQTQNLVAVTHSAIDAYQQNVGVTRDPALGVLLGTAIDRASGLPASGISVRLTAIDGTEVSGQPNPRSAKIYYFDFGGIPRAELKATTPDGRFIVFDAPIGTVSLDVTSPDDTGNVLADSRAGGVTVVRLEVNNAPPESVDVSGRFTPLAGGVPNSAVTLTVAGGDPIIPRRLCPPGSFEREGLCYTNPDARQGLVPKTIVPCDDAATYGPYRVELDGYCQFRYDAPSPAGPFTVPIGSSQEIVLKTSGAGLMDTYTFGVQTGDRGVSGVSAGVVTPQALDAVAASGGRVRAAGTAVIWGQTTAANLGEVDANGNLVPQTCQTWTRHPDDAVIGCNGVGTPGAVVTGSFNDDAYRDLAVIDTTASDPAVTIWLNTGSNSFVRSQRIGRNSACQTNQAGCGVENDPVALVVMDYTRDGISDLVVLNRGSRSVSWLEGRGRGQFVFGGSRVIGPASDPSALAPVDINLDGTPDLMVTDRVSGQVILLVGSGAGFGEPLGGPFVVGPDPRTVVSGHVDFDGIIDLVFVNRETISVVQQVGVTNRKTDYGLPSGVSGDFSAAAIGDVDGNGFNDVMVADRAAGDPRIWLFLNGPGGLATPTRIPAGPQPAAVALNDVNRDRALDLVVVNQGDGTVMYREGDGLGSFGPQHLFPVGGNPLALVMDDVTGDGALDAILSNPGLPNARVSVLPQTTRPVDGIAVAAVTAEGQQVGDVMYLDTQQRAVSGATVTGPSGRFAIFNVPPGPIWLRLLNGGTGSRFLHAYPNGVTNTTFPLIVGPTATTAIRGVTADAVLRPVGEVQIRFLGTQRSTSSNPILYDSQGNATGGADYAVLVEANSDYVVKLSK